MYGQELIIDLENADILKFNRWSLGEFLDQLCLILEVRPETRYFWDELEVPPSERMTDPKHVGTTVIQFLLKSNITIHTLDLLQTVFINIFVCDKFDGQIIIDYCTDFFNAKIKSITMVARG